MRQKCSEVQLSSEYRKNNFTSSDPRYGIQGVYSDVQGRGHFWPRIYSDALSDIDSDIQSDINSHILPEILSGILTDITFDILSGINSAILPDILSDINCDILSTINSDILFEVSLLNSKIKKV